MIAFFELLFLTLLADVMLLTWVGCIQFAKLMKRFTWVGCTVEQLTWVGCTVALYYSHSWINMDSLFSTQSWGMSVDCPWYLEFIEPPSTDKSPRNKIKLCLISSLAKKFTSYLLLCNFITCCLFMVVWDICRF